MNLSDPLTISVIADFVLGAALVGLSVHHYHTTRGDKQ